MQQRKGVIRLVLIVLMLVGIAVPPLLVAGLIGTIIHITFEIRRHGQVRRHIKSMRPIQVAALRQEQVARLARQVNEL